MSGPLLILHADADLVVVSKPAGMMVHRRRDVPSGERYVLQTLSRQIGRHVFPVHRLDRNTSGVLAFALSPQMAAGMQRSMGAPEARKEYLVLVRGETPDHFESQRPLRGRDGRELPACTRFRTLARLARSSLLVARIESGRHHQIRRHLNHLAHQVLGDTTYGKGRINRFLREHHGLPRMFLHAWRLAVSHPRGGGPLEVVAPLADDLRAFLLGLDGADRDLVARL